MTHEPSTEYRELVRRRADGKEVPPAELIAILLATDKRLADFDADVVHARQSHRPSSSFLDVTTDVP